MTPIPKVFMLSHNEALTPQVMIWKILFHDVSETEIFCCMSSRNSFLCRNLDNIHRLWLESFNLAFHVSPYSRGIAMMLWALFGRKI
jgi:hypothetical protein